jgi:methionine aminopeptidase
MKTAAPNIVLKDGDILNIDVTVFLNGFHGDCSEMACVGEVNEAGMSAYVSISQHKSAY